MKAGDLVLNCKSTLAMLVVMIFIGSILSTSIQVEAGTKGWSPEGIAGNVTDETTGRPVYGALVQVAGGYDNTDSNGNYFISVTKTGYYTVSVNKNGFNSTSDSVSLTYMTEFGVAVLDFELDRAVGVSGYVLDMDGNPISGATVVEPGPIYHTTDITGLYYFFESWGDHRDYMAYKEGYWYHQILDQHYITNTVMKMDYYLEANQEEWVTLMSVFCSTDNANIKTKLYWEAGHTTTITVWDYLGGTGDKTVWTQSVGMESYRYNVTGYGLQQKVKICGISSGESTSDYSVESAWVDSCTQSTRPIEFGNDILCKYSVIGETATVLERQSESPGYLNFHEGDSGTEEHTIGLDLTVGLSAKFVSASITLEVGRSEAASDSAEVGVEIWNYGDSSITFEWYMDEDCIDGMVLHLWEI